MKFNVLIILGMMTLTGLLGGCRHYDNSGEVVQRGKLTIYDPSFAVNLNLLQEAFVRTPEGFLRVQVTVENTNERNFSGNYRFVWYDGNGLVQTGASTRARPFVLRGRETTVLEAVSPVPGTADYKLELWPIR